MIFVMILWYFRLCLVPFQIIIVFPLLKRVLHVWNPLARILVVDEETLIRIYRHSNGAIYCEFFLPLLNIIKLHYLFLATGEESVDAIYA